MNHSFDIEIAQKFGVNIAIFLNHIAFWIKKNIANKKHFINGRWWTYSSQSAFLEIFPYWKRSVIRTIIETCVEKNLIIVDKFNKDKYDHTHWYALTDEGLTLFPIIGELINKYCTDNDQSTIVRKSPIDSTESDTSIVRKSPIDGTEIANRLAENRQPIPYTITDTITDREKSPDPPPHFLPDDYEFSPEQCQIGLKHELDMGIELSKFKSHYGGEKRNDWDKKSEMWILRAIEFKKKPMRSGMKKAQDTSSPNYPDLSNYKPTSSRGSYEEWAKSMKEQYDVDVGEYAH